jgi:hypothetical protein
MRLAFTYDLKSAWLARGLSPEQAAEFDSEVTVGAIANHYAARGFTVDRVGGAHELLGRLAAGESWDLAFNICEGFLGSARESLVPALFEHAGVPCVFSDAATLALCLRKDLCKQVVRDAGVPTAPFVVLQHVPTPKPRQSRMLAGDALPLPRLWGRGRTCRSASIFPSLPSRSPRAPARAWAWPAAATAWPRSAAPPPRCWRNSASPFWWRATCPAANSPSASSAPAMKPRRSAAWR